MTLVLRSGVPSARGKIIWWWRFPAQPRPLLVTNGLHWAPRSSVKCMAYITPTTVLHTTTEIRYVAAEAEQLVTCPLFLL
jgi:hypothetical protein